MAKFKRILSDEIRISDSVDLSKYFPSGSTASQAIKLETEQKISNGTLQWNETLKNILEHIKNLEEDNEELKKKIDNSNKHTRKWAIISIISGFILGFILQYLV